MDEQQIITSTTQRTGPREHVLNVMDKSRTAGDNDRIGRLQVDPVLGGKVVEAEQRLEVVTELLGGLRPLGVELVVKGLGCVMGMFAILGVSDLGEHLLRERLNGLGQGVENVRGLVLIMRTSS
jgi:hypothetical protein